MGSESAWFEPPAQPPRRVPIGHDWEERKGWRPPSSSQGLVFAGVSFVLVGAAVAGTIFLLSPEPAAPHHATVTPPAEISTPTTTGADLGSASASASTPEIAEPAPSASIRLGEGVTPSKPKPEETAAAPTPHAAVPRPAPHHAVATPQPARPGRQPRATTPIATPAEPASRPPPERTDLFDTPSGLEEPKAAPSTTAPAPTADPSSQF
jgi:hypothetical protein